MSKGRRELGANEWMIVIGGVMCALVIVWAATSPARGPMTLVYDIGIGVVGGGLVLVGWLRRRRRR